jgi:transposase
MQLVQLVLKKGVLLTEATQQLGIKTTTARFILNKYKETGAFPRRKFKKKGVPRKRVVCKVEAEVK